jgi:hypothetical protein
MYLASTTEKHGKINLHTTGKGRSKIKEAMGG